MAATTRRRRTKRRRKTTEQWWKGFQKTWRYRSARYIVVKVIRLGDRLTDQKELDQKLRNGARSLWARSGTAPRVKGWGHSRFDRRDLLAGKMTDEEWESYQQIVLNRHASIPENDALNAWVEVCVVNRRARRASQGGTVHHIGIDMHPNVAASWDGSPNATVGAPAGTPPFVAPAPPRHPSRPTTSVPPRRPAPRKVSRPVQLRAAWGVRFDKLKEPAMAAGDLTGALATLRAYVEVQPHNRDELHERLAGFAGFFEALGEIAETLQATLARDLPDGSPGVPSSVTVHLNPVAELGALIGQCAKDTANEFEDRFAEAIKAAADAEKPSDGYLGGRRSG